jgi:hypothetical protein
VLSCMSCGHSWEPSAVPQARAGYVASPRVVRVTKQPSRVGLLLGVLLLVVFFGILLAGAFSRPKVVRNDVPAITNAVPELRVDDLPRASATAARPPRPRAKPTIEAGAPSALATSMSLDEAMRRAVEAGR